MGRLPKISLPGTSGAEAKINLSKNNYYPLTKEQGMIITTCDYCLKTFTYAVEHYMHYSINDNCRKALEMDQQGSSNIQECLGTRPMSSLHQLIHIL